MSRTYKDSRRRTIKGYWELDRVQLENYYYLQLPTTRPKLRKEVDTEDHWMTTPSAWTRLMMNRPQRRAGTLWEAGFVNSEVDMESLEEADAPGVSRKPHCYYW